jgi:hypothetical protein
MRSCLPPLADHVEKLMVYSAAVAGKSQAGKATAEKNLNVFAIRLAVYFSGIVHNQLAVVPSPARSRCTTGT